MKKSLGGDWLLSPPAPRHTNNIEPKGPTCGTQLNI